MLPEELIARIAADPGLAPCSEAERQAARALQRVLRADGRDAALEPVWVRPRWAAALALHALLGVGASVLAPSAPAAAAIVLGVALASLLVEASARASVISVLWPRRATQNVVARSPVERPYTLLVTVHLDTGPGGLSARASALGLTARAQRAARGLLPGPFGWVAAALALLLACAAARGGWTGGAAVSAFQLAPTLFLIAVAVLALDAEVSAPRGGAGAAAALATTLALVRALDAAPLRAIAVDLVVAGAGESAALGLRAHLRARAGTLDPARVAVLELAPGTRGLVAWRSHEGPLLAGAAPAQLRRLAAGVARAEAHLGARPVRSRRRSAAYAARQRRLPALAVGRAGGEGEGADDANGNVDGDLLEFCLALALALDEELSSLAWTTS